MERGSTSLTGAFRGRRTACSVKARSTEDHLAYTEETAHTRSDDGARVTATESPKFSLARVTQSLVVFTVVMNVRRAEAAPIYAALRSAVGESLNSRGVILRPATDSASRGTVIFNVMNRNHRLFGRHVWDYAVDADGSIRFVKNNPAAEEPPNL
jgi:hypothetical protein